MSSASLMIWNTPIFSAVEKIRLTALIMVCSLEYIYFYVTVETDSYGTDPSLDWESAISWLRQHTSLPIWLKGGES